MRYLPLGDADRSAMLEKIGAGSVDELFRDVPDGLLLEAADRGTCRSTPARWRSSAS